MGEAVNLHLSLPLCCVKSQKKRDYRDARLHIKSESRKTYKIRYK